VGAARGGTGGQALKRAPTLAVPRALAGSAWAAAILLALAATAICPARQSAGGVTGADTLARPAAGAQETVAPPPSGEAPALADTLSSAVAPQSSGWLRRERLPAAIATLVLGTIILFFIARARRGADLYIRRIAGLEAVDEAVGRATEMGRPILYSAGLDPMEEVATVASINILGQVARKAGQYETRLIMPNRYAIVMTVAQEVVREAYAAAGHPELYDPDDIYYATQSQFGYAAAVVGTMLRERPAANFFIGHFYAESLMLAEMGNATGAIQIAGTDSDSQLPFFICACDYTLIGEELYAGSVYLSREPLLLGALKGQDIAKVIILGILLLGTLLLWIGIDLKHLLS
jgi:hypothetical protein